MIEIEWWWLLVIAPAFFGLGWVAARIDIKHLLVESKRVPKVYFQGLNYLLNDQPDKAIDSLVEVTKQGGATIELTFALGSLFRRQGALEQAIRMHRSLLERIDLEIALKPSVYHALGLDYFKAGLWDRAEDYLGRLLGTEFEASAQQHLLQIYEQEKDWLKAIATRRSLETIHKQLYTKEIAQYYCELATAALINNQLSEARQYADLALAEHRKCIRAYLLLGDIAEAGQDYVEALLFWRRIESQAPEFLGLAATRFVAVYKKQNLASEGLRLVRAYHQQYPSLDLLNALFQLTMEEVGTAGVVELVNQELQNNPSLVTLDKWLDAEILDASVSRKQTLETLKAILYQYIQRLGVYRCQHCGFRAKQYYWRCPGCNQWETYPPKRLEMLEYAR